ncbi:MAG: 4-(cytidine 5'-diphospho)-2-C-methyl-D-erythritol kinase [Epsilonproteobacteria bacterium]|nr:4-(cytidine 5'-diphospho)-2-C-methyl-D-erythritol kinase [Campylobacterota bacterium]
MQYNAQAKVNIFLKIVGIRGSYHELVSRFMLVSNLFDTLTFVPKSSSEPFELVGDFNCTLEQNTLYKIFKTLQCHGFAKEVEAIMREYALHVKKVIPQGAGLGGGSSDAATFLTMLNDVGNLKLTLQEKMELGSKVGADVAFFASGYASANVRGIGEVVEKYDEEALDLEVFTPPLACETARVYKMYREYFLQSMNIPLAKVMVEMKSKALLKAYGKEALNDLYPACLKAYPTLASYAKEGWFFSGSGSSFFRMKEKVEQNG